MPKLVMPSDWNSQVLSSKVNVNSARARCARMMGNAPERADELKAVFDLLWQAETKLAAMLVWEADDGPRRSTIEAG